MADNETTITPEDVKKLLTEFVSRERQTYVGMRYVPKFADPIEWDSDTEYEPLTMVTYNDAVYVSKFYVPADVDISEAEYWARWGSLGTGVVDFDALTDAVRSAYVRTFDTVSDMQAATDLLAGMTCHTNGFHASGDGGAAYYAVSTTGTANGMDVLACQGGLKATLVVTEPYVTPEMFGAYGDGTHDDANAINRALALSDCVMLGAKTYLVGSTISLASDQTIKGCNKFDSIIKGATSLVGAPVVSGSVTSYGPTTATSNTHISLCDIGITYYGGRTQPAILFINCEFTLLDNIYAYCYGGTVDDHCGIWMIRSTSTIDGNTWANRIQNSRLHSTSIYLSENTDCYIHDNDINAMNNPYAIKLETADGLSLRGNQIINKVYCGRNVGITISGNYFDGYYKHDVDTHLIGIEVYGPFYNAIIDGNRFYEMPYEAIIVHGTNAYMQSTTISHNTFENCDIFANGLSDIIVEYASTLNAGINMCGNIHRRTHYVTLSGGVATRHTRTSSSAETKAMPVNVTHGGTVTLRYSLCPTMVACSAYSGNSGYLAQDYTTGLKSLLCYPELIFANTSS